MKQKLGIILVLFVLSLIVVGNVSAADYDRLVTCVTNTCTISSNDPLFFEKNWLPGSNVTKIIRIKNTKSTPLLVYTKADKNFFSSDLGDVIGMKITDQSNQFVKLDSTLTHFFNVGNVQLGLINGNDQKNFSFYADLKKETGNVYQNKETVFSLSLNFSCNQTNPVSPIPTPNPTFKPFPFPLPTPKFDFWWIKYLLERLRQFYR